MRGVKSPKLYKKLILTIPLFPNLQDTLRLDTLKFTTNQITWKIMVIFQSSRCKLLFQSSREVWQAFHGLGMD